MFTTSAGGAVQNSRTEQTITQIIALCGTWLYFKLKVTQGENESDRPPETWCTPVFTSVFDGIHLTTPVMLINVIGFALNNKKHMSWNGWIPPRKFLFAISVQISWMVFSKASYLA